MQQKQEKKENKSGCTKTGLAKMMAALDKEKKAEGQTQLYIDLLKAPRGERYFYWLKETTRLCREIEELEEEIVQLEEEVSKESVSETREVSWLKEEAVKESEIGWLAEEAPVVNNGVVSLKEKKDRLQEMKNQCRKKTEELKKAQQEFLTQLPAPDRLIGILYPGWNTELLMKYGVIACPGNIWKNETELLNQTKPKTEQEKEQWLKGAAAYKNYFYIWSGYEYVPDESFLLVEIYMDQVCVVYKDGTVIIV